MLPAFPVLFIQAVLDGVDGILLDQLLPVLDQLLACLLYTSMEALSKLPVPNIRLLIVGSPFFGRTQQSSFLRKLEQQDVYKRQTYGYQPSEKLHEIFTKYTRTHNQAVFDA